jgi:hypothetical protein
MVVEPRLGKDHRRETAITWSISGQTMNAPQIDPTPRDLHVHESLSADSAARSCSDQRIREASGIVLQTDVQRRIRNEMIGGIVLLVSIVVALFILLLVAS